MWDKDKIESIYIEIAKLGSIKLPDVLWEGGVSTFKIAVDVIRTNQERLSTLIISASRELLLASKREKYAIAFKKKVSATVPWPEKWQSYDQILDDKDTIECLMGNLKLVHGDLNRARSDLKSKIQLLESEAKMGPAGSIYQAEDNEQTISKSVSKSNISEDPDEIDWNDLTTNPDGGI